MDGRWILYTVTVNPEWPFTKAVIEHFKDIDGDKLQGGETFIVNNIPLIAKVGKEPFSVPFEKTLFINVDHDLQRQTQPPVDRIVTILLWSKHRR
jgi:hypothetical protein